MFPGWILPHLPPRMSRGNWTAPQRCPCLYVVLSLLPLGLKNSRSPQDARLTAAAHLKPNIPWFYKSMKYPSGTEHRFHAVLASRCPCLYVVLAFTMSSPSRCLRLHVVLAITLSSPSRIPRRHVVLAITFSSPSRCPRLRVVLGFMLSLSSCCPLVLKNPRRPWAARPTAATCSAPNIPIMLWHVPSWFLKLLSEQQNHSAHWKPTNNCICQPMILIFLHMKLSNTIPFYYILSSLFWNHKTFHDVTREDSAISLYHYHIIRLYPTHPLLESGNIASKFHAGSRILSSIIRFN